MMTCASRSTPLPRHLAHTPPDLQCIADDGWSFYPEATGPSLCESPVNARTVGEIPCASRFRSVPIRQPTLIRAVDPPALRCGACRVVSGRPFLNSRPTSGQSIYLPKKVARTRKAWATPLRGLGYIRRRSPQCGMLVETGRRSAKKSRWECRMSKCMTGEIE